MVLLALMVSQALILSIIESWLPTQALFPAVPGVKLGLANIITMVVIVFFDLKDVLAVVIVRCILASIYGGGLMVFMFSITGGILSALVMWLLYKFFSTKFSLMGISIAGAVTHNAGQILIASVLMKTLAVFSYLPILLVSGIIMGLFVGLCSNFMTKALEKSLKLKK